eukprot:g4572.t1
MEQKMDLVENWIKEKAGALGDHFLSLWAESLSEKKNAEEFKKFVLGPTQLLIVAPRVRESKQELHFRAGRMRSSEAKGRMLILTKHHPKSIEATISNTRNAEVHGVLDNNIDWTVCSGHIIEQMNAAFAHLYLPLFESKDTEGSSKEEGRDMRVGEQDFSNQIHKFSSHVSHAIRHLSDQVEVSIPDVDFKTMSEGDARIVLQPLIEKWTQILKKTVEQESGRRGEDGGPLMEVQYWKYRNAIFSALYHRFNSANVRKALHRAYDLGFEGVSTFKSLHAEVIKSYTEAKDNVKFLATLERHFHNIADGSIARAHENIMPMMNAMRMVWIISKHFNTDERMVPLMTRIADQLVDKVTNSIDTVRLFRKAPSEIKQHMGEARGLLEAWKRVYMEVRAKIEKATDNRWEFNKKLLFERSDCVAKRCRDIAFIATTIDEFRSFLGPDLESLSSDIKRVDLLNEKVNLLIAPFESVEFNIFDIGKQTEWNNFLSQFQESVVEIENLTKSFVDDTFERLRSSVGAFKLLQNFGRINTRKSIDRKMMQKFDNILQQYSFELTTIKRLFEESCDNPPTSRTFPPISGAIVWAADLFERAKDPIMQFRNMPRFLDSEYGEKVKTQYLEIAEKIDTYIHNLFEQWTERHSTMVESLKGSILGPAMTKKGSLAPPPYHVNFPEILSDTIREAIELEKLGFVIPEMALNIVLQKEKYDDYRERLKSMLDSYHGLVESLSPIESDLLAEKLRNMQSELKNGFLHLNWNSLHVNHFIDSVNKEIGDFESLRLQVRGQSDQINAIVEMIKDTQLLPLNDIEARTPMDATELFEIIDGCVADQVEQICTKYHEIGPLLTKIEELVVLTSTMRCEGMRKYYQFWEVCVYNALCAAILRTLIEYESLLGATTANRVSCADGKPLCKLFAIMNITKNSFQRICVLKEIFFVS